MAGSSWKRANSYPCDAPTDLRRKAPVADARLKQVRRKDVEPIIRSTSSITMKILISRAPYSYRIDEAVPGFVDTGPVTVMDGECALCSAGARLIARLDKP